MKTEEVQRQVYRLAEEVVKRIKKENPEKYQELLKKFKTKEAKHHAFVQSN
jgi:lauroyl/myristoyl acyltransferase